MYITVIATGTIYVMYYPNLHLLRTELYIRVYAHTTVEHSNRIHQSKRKSEKKTRQEMGEKNEILFMTLVLVHCRFELEKIFL